MLLKGSVSYTYVSTCDGRVYSVLRFVKGTLTALQHPIQNTSDPIQHTFATIPNATRGKGHRLWNFHYSIQLAACIRHFPTIPMRHSGQQLHTAVETMTSSMLGFWILGSNPSIG
jgi:hypothetical protein